MTDGGVTMENDVVKPGDRFEWSEKCGGRDVGHVFTVKSIRGNRVYWEGSHVGWVRDNLRRLPPAKEVQPKVEVGQRWETHTGFIVEVIAVWGPGNYRVRFPDGSGIEDWRNEYFLKGATLIIDPPTPTKNPLGVKVGQTWQCTDQWKVIGGAPGSWLCERVAGYGVGPSPTTYKIDNNSWSLVSPATPAPTVAPPAKPFEQSNVFEDIERNRAPVSVQAPVTKPWTKPREDGFLDFDMQKHNDAWAERHKDRIKEALSAIGAEPWRPSVGFVAPILYRGGRR